MPDKKKPHRETSTKRVKQTSGSVGRRRYTQGNAAQCSIDKRAGSADAVPAPKAITQLKFMKATRTRTRSAESSPLIPAKPMNNKQKACKKWFDKLKEQGLRGIRREFITKIKDYKPDMSTDAFNDEANIQKNRYDDVFLLDKTRVKIRKNPNNDDYIHASYVEVRPGLTYICAQGPLDNSLEQFWLMCVQEEVKVILQLCRNVEGKAEKCAEYLPSNEEWISFGSVQVRLISKEKDVPGTRKVEKSVVVCKFEGREFKMTHLLYAGWPDHGPADSVSTCRELRTLVHKLHESKPIVAHCSAGIGRTGTFVAIEMVCNKLLNEFNGDFDIVAIMKDLRNQRIHAVQNDQQYSFVYRVVIEILIAEDGLAKSADVNKFIQDFEEMVQRKKAQMLQANLKKQNADAN